MTVFSGGSSVALDQEDLGNAAPAGGFCNTPLNRHDEMAQSCPLSGFEVRYDYLSGIGVIPNIKPLLDYLDPVSEKWAIEPHGYTKGPHHFKILARTVEGIRVHFYDRDDGAIVYRLTLPGGWFASRTLRDSIRMFSGLYHAYKLRATRVDIAFDDYRRSCSVGAMKKALKQKNYYGFINWTFIESSSQKGGWTLGLGSRNSTRYVRVYDALPLHGIDATRYELELKEKHAQTFFELVNGVARLDRGASSDGRDSAYARNLAAFVFDGWGFAKRPNDQHLSRAKPIPWWRRFRNRIGESELVLNIPKPERTLSRTFAWMDRQVAPTLSALADGLGARGFKRYISGLVSTGRSNRSSYGDAMAAALVASIAGFLDSA